MSVFLCYINVASEALFSERVRKVKSSVSWVIPDLFVQTIYEIDFKALQHQGIKAIITDLDNTLVASDRPNATPELVNWLETLQSMGFRVIIVSNNRETRVSKFARPLNVPYIPTAKKPFNTPFRKALNRLEVTPDQTVVIGDQLFTDVLGGNLAGLYTILVVPVSQTEGLGTKLNRVFEKFVFHWMKTRGMKRWEE